MAEGPGAPTTDPLADVPSDPEVGKPRKKVQMSCRMPNCNGKEHYEVLGAGGVPQRVYECCSCGNVWSTNLGGHPNF